MAVEEIVKENTPKAEGEAQGVKYISLTDLTMNWKGPQGPQAGREPRKE